MGKKQALSTKEAVPWAECQQTAPAGDEGLAGMTKQEKRGIQTPSLAALDSMHPLIISESLSNMCALSVQACWGHGEASHNVFSSCFPCAVGYVALAPFLLLSFLCRGALLLPPGCSDLRARAATSWHVVGLGDWRTRQAGPLAGTDPEEEQLCPTFGLGCAVGASGDFKKVPKQKRIPLLLHA